MKEWKNSRKEYKKSPKQSKKEDEKVNSITRLLSSSPQSSRRDSPANKKAARKDEDRDNKGRKNRERSSSRSRSRSREKRLNRRKESSSSSRERSRERASRREEIPQKKQPQSPEKFGRKSQEKEDPVPEAPKKVEPDFKPSGILAKFTNTVNGVVLKFTEPPDAKVPSSEWRLYPFKEDKELEIIYLKKQSCFLFGKDKRVADIVLAHPTISSQHAVIQFREILTYDDEGNVKSEIKPYLMDLESTNGTMINGDKIEAARYIELLHSDVIRFAHSTRDYVLFKTKVN